MTGNLSTSGLDALVCVPTRWRGLPAQLIIGSELEIVVMTVGAHLACIRFRGETLNPLWQPTWPSADPATVEPLAGGPYGPGSEAKLLACIVGSNLCVDRFGDPWPGERKPLHGESGIVRYQVSQPRADRVDFTASLPEAGLRIQRHVHLVGNVVHLATIVAHPGGTDRDIEWCEHTTLGDPFLDGAEFSADADVAFNWPGFRDAPNRFAHLAPGAAIPLREALSMPQAHERPSDDVIATRAIGGTASWSATNPRLGRRLSVRWESRQFPWLTLWTHNRGLGGAPWRGQERARGMELSTKPFPEGKPPPERAQSFHQRNTTCAIPPGEGRKHALTLTWERL